MSGPIISDGWVGRIIDGRFALHEWLGGSGSSGVFRTDLPQPITKRTAIKLIPVEGAQADAYVAGWAKAEMLSHPHLIRVFRAGRFHFGSIGLVYVVMECADEVLAQILPSRSLTTDETREMLTPVMDALGYLHEKGYVHGHLKPSNILVVDDEVKISSDGVGAGGRRNRFDALSVYEAPEAESGVLSSASDVWSLGVTLVETLTQRVPQWERKSGRAPMLPEGMPPVFAEIARDCLRLDPDERCSLAEIKARLEPNKPIAFPTAAKKETGSDDAVAAEERGSGQDSGQRKIPAAPLALGLMAVVVIAAILMMRSCAKQDATQSAGSESVPAQVTAPPATSGGGKSSAQVAPAAGVSGAASSAPTEKRLVEKGAVLEQKMPDVAPQARRTIHGTVTVAVQVEVDANGKVTDASFKTEGPSKYFARVALEAARGWTFKPAEKSGEAVPSAWVIHFKFRERGDEATAVEERR